MKRLAMRKIKEAIRLNAQGLSPRRIGESLGIGRTTVQECLGRARAAGLSWPLSEELSDGDIEQRLYPRATGAVRDSFPQPDWAYVHRELRRKGVTLSLLWEEYRSVHPDGYAYSRFCELYNRWEGRLSPVMRQRHVAGERLFVDYSGTTLDVICPKTGEIKSAQLFVATLGASNYTYVEATWTQSLPDWISSHVRAFDFFGGVSAQVVSDNLKSGVTKACFYEPTINRTYGDMAAHYDTAIVPARPYKPRDKAKVEGAVLIAQRWIVARLRNQRFFSLDELNEAIRALNRQLNSKITRHLGASRRDLFERLDQPALKPLPVEPYIYAEWKQCSVALDYHIDVERHYYSVPHQLLRQKLWVRITNRTVEAFHKGKRVAAHARTSSNYQHTTCRDHMPSGHRRYADWTPQKLVRQASRIGPNTATLAEVILRERRHREQGFRACMGIVRLAKTHGNERLEAACERALEINARSYGSVKSILQNNLERRRRQRATEAPAITHPNIRGARYFH
ncbi:MAG: IS21 family transposase [Alphaproteobacteria bacterium]|nr:IS21 family transposase [Alphaproteobacteria bacterium]